MKQPLTLAIAILWMAAAPALHACGFCVEDKVAATYDHALITRALDRGHEVLFFEIVGAVAADAAQRRALTAAVASVRGVQRGSVRTSIAPPALSFAFDASRSSSAVAVARINDRLRKLQLKVELIRTIAEHHVATR